MAKFRVSASALYVPGYDERTKKLLPVPPALTDRRGIPIPFARWPQEGAATLEAETAADAIELMKRLIADGDSRLWLHPSITPGALEAMRTRIPPMRPGLTTSIAWSYYLRNALDNGEPTLWVGEAKREH